MPDEVKPPEDIMRMAEAADRLPDRDDETAGTPDHNMSADALEARAAAQPEGGAEPAAQDVGETAVGAEVSPPTRIPVVDGDVAKGPDGTALPDAHIDRAPGINAPYGDPRYVDPESPSVEKDLETAHAMAAEMDDRMMMGKINRSLAQEDLAAGKEADSAVWAENAKWQEHRAGREGYWAGILHNHPINDEMKKHGVWVRDEKITNFTPEELVEIEDYAQDLQSLLERIRSGKTDPAEEPIGDAPNHKPDETSEQAASTVNRSEPPEHHPV